MLFNDHAKRAHAPMTDAARREAIQREALDGARRRMESTRAKGWVRQQAFANNLAFLIRHDPLWNDVPPSLRTKITLLLNTVAPESTTPSEERR